ncbi:MAG: pentapeptide repeat-containing protein [Cyanobacteriota bacterium]|nr:pentapeptide repeat-containing protein [Cyanobacteriota bacterium]
MDASQLLSRYAIGEKNFREVNLREANLSRANLSAINLSDADLRQANLFRANLIGANFIRANLSGANLGGANLMRVNVSGANLWGANLSETDLRRADLRGADLRGADLMKAKLRGSDVRGADLRGADLSEVNLIGADLRRSDFSQTYLSRANLTRANLDGADLSGSDLRGVILTRVQAVGTNFEGAILTGAYVEDWQIDRYTNLNHVICDYIYLKEDRTERRPKNPNKTFSFGEFVFLVQKDREALNLIFAEGIDWRAFLLAFEQLHVEFNNSGAISVQTLGYESDGIFAVGLSIPMGADRDAIAHFFEHQYAQIVKQLERQDRTLFHIPNSEIQHYREQNANLTNIMSVLAAAQPVRERP